MPAGYRSLVAVDGLAIAVRPGFGVAAVVDPEPTTAVVVCGSTVEPIEVVAARVAHAVRSGGAHEDAGVVQSFGAINGHVAAVVATGERVVTLTDQLGSTPVYVAGSAGAPIAGTDLTDVAHAAGAHFDAVSVAEFVRYGIVTSPYTVFDGVTRQWPAMTRGVGSESVVSPWWMPPVPTHTDGREIAAGLEAALSAVMRTIAEQADAVTVTYSGGEDSRIVAAWAARAGMQVSGVTFIDAPNREYRHARLAARATGIRLDARRRRPDHDAVGLVDRSRAVGPGIDLLHAHAHDLIDPRRDHVPVLDGWFATLLKADDAPTCRKKWRTVPMGLAEIDPRHLWSADGVDVGPGGAIGERRAEKEARLGYLPPPSQREWARLWPLSDVEASGWLAYNQVSFPALSPFALPVIVDLAARVAPSGRVNRVLLKSAFARGTGLAAWVPRTDGEILALPPRLDQAAAAVNKFVYKVGERVRTRNNGPWQNNVTRSAAAADAIDSCDPDALAVVVDLAELGGVRLGGWQARHRAAQLSAVIAATGHPAD